MVSRHFLHRRFVGGDGVHGVVAVRAFLVSAFLLFFLSFPLAFAGGAVGWTYTVQTGTTVCDGGVGGDLQALADTAAACLTSHQSPQVWSVISAVPCDPSVHSGCSGVVHMSRANPTGDYHFYFSGTYGTCPAGTTANAAGECVAAPTCPDSGTPHTEWRLMKYIDGSDVPLDKVYPASIVRDGCIYNSIGDGAVLGCQEFIEGSYCQMQWVASGDTGTPSGDPDNAEAVQPVSAGVDHRTNPVQTDHVDPAPTVTTLADSSTQTMEQHTVTVSGGGTFSVVHTPDGAYTITKIGDSSSSVHTVVTTTDAPDGAITTITQATSSWTNGAARQETVSSSGSVSATATPSASGGSTTTTNKNCTAAGDCTTNTTTDQTGQGDSNGDGQQDQSSQSFAGTGWSDLDQVPSYSDSVSTFVAGIQASPIMSGFSAIAAAIPDGSGAACPTYTFEVFSQTFSLSPGCSIYEDNKGVLSTVFLAAWALAAAFVLLSA